MILKKHKTSLSAIFIIFMISISGCNNDNSGGNISGTTAGTSSDYTSGSGNAIASEGLKVTFVELGSVNCIPCKMMKPVMDKIEQTYPGQVKVIFYDVWTEVGKASGAKFAIRVIPTQVFLDKDGKEYYRHEGFFPFEEVDKILKQKGVN